MFMILPADRLNINTLKTLLVRYHVPRPMLCWASKSSTFIVRIMSFMVKPALLTSTSTLPAFFFYIIDHGINFLNRPQIGLKQKSAASFFCYLPEQIFCWL